MYGSTSTALLTRCEQNGKKDSPVASEAEAEDDIKVKGEEGGAEEDEGDALA